MHAQTHIIWPWVFGFLAIGLIGQYIFFPLQIYIMLIGLIMLGILITILFRYHKLWPALIEEQYEELMKIRLDVTPDFREKWEVIRQAMKSKDLNELRVAVIDADTLAEDLLRQQGLQGDTMAALISEATLRGVIGTSAVLRFHRLRNRLVHDSNFTSHVEELRTYLQALDKVLIRWGAVLPK